jgi:mono/diheme cytochrome c family protein
MKTRSLYLLFLAMTTALLANANPPLDEGRIIFTARCSGCHNVNKIVTGPALAGVDQRHSIDWIINFVHSSQTVIKGGDQAAVTLFEKFNKIPMPDHPDLTADNIKNIVEYIKSEASTNTGADKAPFDKPGKLHPRFIPLSINNYGFFIGYFIAVVLLIAALLAAVKVKEIERALS